MRFRPRGFYVEAEQFCPPKPAPHGVCFCAMYAGKPHLHTVKGSRRVKPTDWIVRTASGRVYNAPDREFRQGYEEVAA